MSKKKYRNKTSRSRRKSVRRRGRVVSADSEEIQLSLPLPQVLAAAHGAVEALAGEAGLLIIKALIDEEVEQLAGPRYSQDKARKATRWGHEDGYVVFNSKKVPVKRPRVRSSDGKEIQLQRYQQFQGERLQNVIAEKVLHGVSMRNFEGVIDDLCDGYGIQKSSVSREWKAATTKELDALLQRPLGDLDLAAIMIDGIHFHDYLLVVALGIDCEGSKHVLGIWDGPTENSTLVTELLANLVERGLSSEKRYLFIIDGSKALRKGIVSVFGNHALIQRCQIHKARNIIDYLPKRHQRPIRRALKAAWGMLNYDDAKEELEGILKRLRKISSNAASSLEEGLEETLTLHRIKAPASLRPALRSTNSIESTFARNRTLCRNVKNWRSPEMALRWACTSLLYAEKSYRRLKGYRDMPTLLKNIDEVDNKEAVA